MFFYAYGVSQCVLCGGPLCVYEKVNRWTCDGLFIVCFIVASHVWL